MPCRHRSDFKSLWKRAEGHVCVKWSNYDCNSVDTVPVLLTQGSEGNLVCKSRSKYHRGRAALGVSGRALSHSRVLSHQEAVSLILKTANKTQKNPSGSPTDSWHGAFGSWSYCAKWKKLWAEGFLSGASIHTADRTRKYAATKNRLIVEGLGSDNFSLGMMDMPGQSCHSCTKMVTTKNLWVVYFAVQISYEVVIDKMRMIVMAWDAGVVVCYLYDRDF